MALSSRVESPYRTPIFPPWFDNLVKALGLLAVFGGLHFLAVVYLGFNPSTTDVGYQPVQPVPYSHKVHAGDLGMDCRYCHISVDVAAKATIPPTATCMNCHLTVHTQSEKLDVVRKSAEAGDSIPWVRVHDLADFVFFNHSAHVTRGIGCVSCHGRIDRMEVVYQDQPLSMGWCLDCHRNPEPHLRPLSEITNMTWVADDQATLGAQLRKEYNVNPSESCSTCHR